MSRRIPQKTSNGSPLFTKINIKKNTSKKIHYLQASFERFTESMIRKCPNNLERQQAIYRMQEACVWFCRSMATRDFIAEEEIGEPEIIKLEPSQEETLELEEDKKALILANIIEQKENKPKIIIKKKFTLSK